MNKSTDIYTVKNPNSKTNKGGYKIDHKRDYPDFVITQNNWDILINPKTNRKLEIDILIKDKDGNIICGVEYNGERFHNKNNPEKENYKSFLCEEKGFKLFHIWTSSKNEDLENLYSFLRK